MEEKAIIVGDDDSGDSNELMERSKWLYFDLKCEMKCKIMKYNALLS